LAAKQSAALGNKCIASLETTFSSSGRGVAVLDAAGRIGWMNAAAEAAIRDAELVSNSRLRSLDETIGRRLADLVERALAFRTGIRLVLAAPVLVPTSDGRTLSVDAIPMPRDFQSLLTSAAVL